MGTRFPLALALITVRHPETLSGLKLPEPRMKEFFAPKEGMEETTKGRHQGAARDTGIEMTAGWIFGKDLFYNLRALEQSGSTASFVKTPNGATKIEIRKTEEGCANLSLDDLILAIARNPYLKIGVSAWDNHAIHTGGEREANVILYLDIQQAPHKLREQLEGTPLEFKMEINDKKPFITRWAPRLNS
jgi:hypothetical protein